MASITQFYPTSRVAFYARTTPLLWHGGWDQEAVRTSITPTYSTSGGNGVPLSPGGNVVFPMMALAHYKAGSVKFNTSIIETSATNPWRVSCWRGVSDPLEAQTISGTFDVCWGVFGAAAGNISYRVYLAVLEGDTDNIRGVLGTQEDSLSDLWPSAGAFGKTLEAPMVLTPLDIQAGDRLLLEIGGIARNAVTTNVQLLMSWGQVRNHAVLADITDGEASTVSNAPVVTFSNAIAVQDLLLEPTDLVVGNADIFVHAHDGTRKGVKLSIGSDGEGSGVGINTGSAITLWMPHAERGAERYDQALVLQNTINDGASTHQPHVIRRPSAEGSDAIWVGNPNKSGPCDSEENAPSDLTAFIQKMSGGGTVQAWAPAGQYSGVPTFDFRPDGDTIYYTSLGNLVKSYTLSTNTQNADVVTLPPITFDAITGFIEDGTFFRGIRCLADGTFLVSTVTVTAGVQTASDIRHYTGDGGTLLHTYSVPGQVDWGALALTTDELSFWVANTGNGNINDPTIVRFGIASAAVEVTITGDDQVLDTLTGAHLCSGGLCVIPHAGGPTPPGTIIVDKVTSPAVSTLFAFTAGGGLVPTAFFLSHGQSRTFAGLPPGDSYHVEETPDPDYDTTVEVSNGSPISAISVGADETVTVTFTNTAKPPPPPTPGSGCPTEDWPVSAPSDGACAVPNTFGTL